MKAEGQAEFSLLAESLFMSRFFPFPPSPVDGIETSNIVTGYSADFSIELVYSSSGEDASITDEQFTKLADTPKALAAIKSALVTTAYGGGKDGVVQAGSITGLTLSGGESLGKKVTLKYSILISDEKLEKTVQDTGATALGEALKKVPEGDLGELKGIESIEGVVNTKGMFVP